MRIAPWERQYYHELKREKRKKMLDEAVQREGMSPANELRQKLLDARYGKNPDNSNLDFFIRGFVNMSYVKSMTNSFFGKKKGRRMIESILNDWNFALAEEYGEIGREVLYQELYNMTLLYIDLCRRDKNYSGVLLGIGKMNEDNLKSKISRDVINAACDIPKAVGIEDQVALFTDAALDALQEEFPELEESIQEAAGRK